MISLAGTVVLALAAIVPADAAKSRGRSRRTRYRPATKRSSNEIKCRAVAMGGATSVSDSAFVDLGRELGELACDGSNSDALREPMTDIATAFAQARTLAVVNCQGKGDGVYGFAQAHAQAEAHAHVSAKAVVDGFVSIDKCKHCKATAEVMGEAFEEAFLHVTAESKAEVEALGKDNTTGGAFVEKMRDAMRDTAQKTLRAFARLDLTAKIVRNIKDGEETCGVTARGCVAAGKERACCNVKADALSKAVSENARAEERVVVHAVSEFCGADAADRDSATARAVAKAWVRTVADLDGQCKATQGSTICAWGSAEIKTAARAHARAWAKAWVGANNKCGCQIGSDNVAWAFENIFVNAHSKVKDDACASGNLSRLDDYERDMEDQVLVAIATTMGKAAADAGCRTESKSCANVFNKKDLDQASSACCTLSLEGTTDEYYIDAVADAGAVASTMECSSDSISFESTANSTVRAMAEAYAKAVLDIDARCHKAGRAGACSFYNGRVGEWATAYADAFSSAFAGAAEDCGCGPDHEAMKETWFELSVDVFVHVRDSICARKDTASITDVRTVTDEILANRAILATAYATLTIDDSGCTGEATTHHENGDRTETRTETTTTHDGDDDL